MTLLTLIISSGTTGPLFAGEDLPQILKKEFSKTITQQYPISADGKVDIHNKYGEVNIHTWANNEVKIEVVIKVEARSESKANEIFDRIKVDFTNSTNYVSATTVIGESSSWFSWWGSSSSGEYKINYEVYMPATNNLELYNKYGDSFVSTLGGDANFEIKYGNLQTADIGKALTLDIGYGNANIGQAGKTKVVIKYGKIKMIKAADATIDSKYSKVYIDQANDLRCTSKYDQYRLGNVRDFHSQGKYDDIQIISAHSIDATAKYSDYDVEVLMRGADFDLEYGSASIRKLAKDFAGMEIRGRYTEYKIEVEEGTHYELDVATNHSGLRYPETLQVVYEKEQGSEHEVKGYTGNREQAKLIKVRLDYGGLKMRH